MSLPVRHLRWLLLALLLPFAALGGAVAAGRLELRLADAGDCLDGAAAACLTPATSLGTLLLGALLAAAVVVYATMNLTRLRA